MAKAKKTPSGSWRVLIYIGKDNAGERHYKSFTAATKAGAELAALRWRQSRPSPERMTLREAYQAYIADRDAVLSESTLAEYERIVRRSESPLMDRRIDEIRQTDVQAEINALARRLSPKTVRNRYGLFSAVMGQYRPDAVFRVKLPQKRREEVYIPDEDAVLRLYDALVVSERWSWLIVPFLLASQCGLRASEIAGLYYRYVDRPNRRIRVCQALVAGRHGQTLKAPKSVSGDRYVPASEMVFDAIGDGDPDERVCPYASHYISEAWHRFILTTDETPFSFHKLRHFFCSRALLAGIPKRYVADFLGHAGENMVDRVYQHTFPSARDEFAEKLTKTAVFDANATANATQSLATPDK